MTTWRAGLANQTTYVANAMIATMRSTHQLNEFWGTGQQDGRSRFFLGS